jgi:hypothetical protein
MMLQDIQNLEPFKIKPGRCHQKFSDMEVSPTNTVNTKTFFQWLQRHKKQIGMGQKCQLQKRYKKEHSTLVVPNSFPDFMMNFTITKATAVD